MKVVLFCGGLGMRLRDYSETIPKPMVKLGYRPILWHVMKYYAHFGHKDFIPCLGHRADVVKNCFLNYNECASNDFVLPRGGKCHWSHGNGRFQDKQQLENLWRGGTAPWEVWKANRTKPSLSKAVASSETPCIP